MTTEVKIMTYALMGSKSYYEKVRQHMIHKYSYNAFFDIQHEAFKILFGRVK